MNELTLRIQLHVAADVLRILRQQAKPLTYAQLTALETFETQLADALKSSDNQVREIRWAFMQASSKAFRGGSKACTTLRTYRMVLSVALDIAESLES